MTLSRCTKCQGFVFPTLDAATRRDTGADIVPVTRQGYIDALMGGVTLFDAQEAAGRPQKLHVRHLGSPAPTFDPGGAQASAEGVPRVLREHGCRGARYEAVKATPKALGAPATPGGGSSGNHPPAAPVAGGQGVATPSAAGPATRHRSRPVRCSICDRLVTEGESFTGIECGTYVWAAHTECE